MIPDQLLRPPNEDLFFSRQDPEDPRLGEFAQNRSLVEAPPTLSTLWGYPESEGIRRNGGRPGAEEAPDRIRMMLYRMTPARNWPRQGLVHDRGNWDFENHSMEEKAEILRQAVRDHYSAAESSFLVTLGGGHDFGYPDGAGFIEAHLHKGQRPLILNFDAHLDVRPLDRGLTSGTPFRKLIEIYRESFDFVEVGIQPHCNSPFHWDWAQDNGAFLLPLEKLRSHGLVESLEETLESSPRRPLWISLDIDCLNSSEAPGCSAPNASGLSVQDLQKLWPWLFRNFDVKGLGIYEVSPPLDQDSRTSRIAALMIHSSLNELIRRNERSDSR